MKHLFGICVLIGFMSALTSCRDNGDDLIDPNKYPQPYTLTGQFEAIWTGINQNYVFWEIDPVDWDDVYARYHPRFEALDRQESVSTEDLQALYEEICGQLVDNHMVVKLLNLKAPDDETNKIVAVRPGILRLNKRENQNDGVWLKDLQACRDKMKESGRITHDMEYSSELPSAELLHMLTYVVDEDVLYLGPGSFYVISNLDNPDVYAVYDTYIRQLLFNDDIKGVIVDLRGNGGGMLWDMFTILGPLLKEPCHVLDSKTKMGTGRLDYGEWTPFIAEAMTQRQIAEMMKWEEEMPESTSIGDRQLVVLVNRFSASMSEMTALGAKKLPYATVIGEQTFGATGPLTSDTHISFSGQFGDYDLQALPYAVITSTWLARTTDGAFVEGVGIVPDITVPLDCDKLASQHIDNQLEHAINLLHERPTSKAANK